MENKHTERLTASTAGLELTAGEKHTLKWICEWEPSTVENVASVIEKARGAAGDGLTRKDLLTCWGFMQALKDIYEGKARDAAARGDALGSKLAGDYMSMAAEIQRMQAKFNSITEGR